MRKFFVTAILFLSCSFLSASLRDAYNFWNKKDFKSAEKTLEKLQVENPYDVQINYNLGNVKYRLGKYAIAKESFKRSQSGKLTISSTFNFANSCYKNTLAMLGEGWEKKKLEDELIQKAIKEVKESLSAYKKFLEKKPDDEHGKANMQHAEELLKKLEEKEQQDQNQDNDDQQKDQNDDQDKQDKKDQDNKDDKKDSDKKNGSDKQDQSEDGEKDKNKDQDQQKNNDPEDGNGDNKENEKDNKDNNSEEEQQDKGEDEKEQPSQQDGAAGQEEQGDMEEKGMRALLDKLQSDEEKLQKALIKHKVAGNMEERQKGQKNW